MHGTGRKCKTVESRARARREAVRANNCNEQRRMCQKWDILTRRRFSRKGVLIYMLGYRVCQQQLDGIHRDHWGRQAKKCHLCWENIRRHWWKSKRYNSGFANPVRTMMGRPNPGHDKNRSHRESRYWGWLNILISTLEVFDRSTNNSPESRGSS